MTEYIKGVQNELPFYYFEQISKIPRASGNEAEIAVFLENFAKSRGLWCYKDAYNNVLIVKGASSGRDNEPSIMLQAHTDMVAEKNASTVHNFSVDSIKLVQENNILKANGTTLGADDGFGVAIMLAILADDTISHPMLECLFTSSEEIGLVGASKFDYSKIKSRKMINLDSAEEETVIVGCCGGVRTELSLPVTKIENSVEGVKLTIGGLCGGHSGEDIDRGRLNSNVLMGMAIKEIMNRTPVKIAYISGGDKDNAIPRECEAIIVPYESDATSSCLAYASTLQYFINKKIKADEDKGVFLNAELVKASYTFTKKDTENILKVLSTQNAVLQYRTIPPILPESSRNLARIRTGENTVDIGFSSRSYLESKLDESTNELDKLARLVGGHTRHHERYPGWQSELDSSLVKDWQKAYNKVIGKSTTPTLIHAGLECGLISASLDGLVAISIGCNVHDLHTPKECMELDSMDRIYQALIEFLK